MRKTLYSTRHKELVQFLVNMRRNAGMTQVELAKALGEYQSFVARLESGQRRVDVVEFERLAEIMGFDVREFFVHTRD